MRDRSEGTRVCSVVALLRVSFVTPGLVLPQDSCKMDRDGTMNGQETN
jgi:hypothetical protein